VKTFIQVLLMSLTLCFPAYGSPMDGSWQVVFPSDSRSGSVDADSDSFSLDIWSNGNSLCANHQATAHLGMRVDEDEDDSPSVTGTIKGSSALVDYRSTGWGGSGHAKIWVKGKTLHWHVLSETGETWFPSDANLTRLKGSVALSRHKPLCLSTKDS
jgi:hypothetical protein